jgi:hypothetical protein
MSSSMPSKRMPPQRVEFALVDAVRHPRVSFETGTSKTSQLRSKVVMVMGRPASICSQWGVEKPNESMSS